MNQKNDIWIQIFLSLYTIYLTISIANPSPLKVIILHIYCPYAVWKFHRVLWKIIHWFILVKNLLRAKFAGRNSLKIIPFRWNILDTLDSILIGYKSLIYLISRWGQFYFIRMRILCICSYLNHNNAPFGLINVLYFLFATISNSCMQLMSGGLHYMLYKFLQCCIFCLFVINHVFK